MLLISFPHNPTTTCVDLDFLREIVRLARHHGTLIVHDFAYADLGFDGYEPPSILQVEGAKEIAVEIFSLSKSYNMAGWRVGFCLGNPKMIAALARIKSYLDYGVFQPIQIASIIALRECEEDTKKICAIYQKRRDVLVKGLNRAGWPVEPPRGSMFLWAPIPEKYRAIGSLEFAKLVLEKAQVAVSPGIGFGPLGEGHVRFALGRERAAHPPGDAGDRAVPEGIGRRLRTKWTGRRRRRPALQEFEVDFDARSYRYRRAVLFAGLESPAPDGEHSLFVESETDPLDDLHVLGAAIDIDHDTQQHGAGDFGGARFLGVLGLHFVEQARCGDAAAHFPDGG